MPQKRTIPRVCEYCGEPFMAGSTAVKDGKARFCSRPCADAGKPHPPRPPRGHIEEDRGYSTACWIWQGGRKNGYAVMGHPARRVHRINYEAKYGPVPAGKELDHLCKQKECVNPDHVEAVTHTENVRRGPHTVLDWEKVREIRRLAGTIKNAEMGRRFGVTETQIGYILRNKQWRE